MKIYFAGSVRGGTENAELFKEIINILRKYGEVIGGEHADETLASLEGVDNKSIYDRDSRRLDQTDVLVAEVSTPSLGVGYEIGVSVKQNKKVLTLFKESPSKKLSAMISGSPNITNKTYQDLEDIEEILEEFFS